MIPLSLPSRLCLYDMTRSQVTLMAQHGSDQHQVLVCTELVEPFQAQVGSLYLVIGELGHQQGKQGPPRTCLSTLGDSPSVTRLGLSLASDPTGVPPWG